MKVHVPYISLRLIFYSLFIRDLNLRSDKYNCILYSEPSKHSINNKREFEYTIAIPYYKSWLLAAMRPFVDCWDDFVNTFKPYKTIHHIKSDILQPVSGVLNILYGFLSLALSVLFFLAVVGFIIRSIPGYLFMMALLPLFLLLNPDGIIINKKDKQFFSDVSIFSFYMFCYFIEGISTITRGLIQLITFPMTWFIKIPLRALVLTPILGFQKFEDDRGLNRLLNISKTPLTHINGPIEALIDEKIRNKVERATEQGRKLPYSSIEGRKLPYISIGENICFFRAKRILNFLEPVTRFTLNTKKFNQLVPKRQLEITNKLVLGFHSGKNAKQETDNVVKILKEEKLYVQRDIRTLIWAAEKGHIKGSHGFPKEIVEMIAGFMRPL